MPGTYDIVVQQAVDIVKSAVAASPQLASSPKHIAETLEALTKKLHELRYVTQYPDK